MATLEIRADAGRAQELLTVDEMLLVIEGSEQQTFEPRQLRTLVEMVAKFVWGGEDYLPFEEARAQVGKLNLRQLTEAARALFTTVEDSAVPPANGAGSAPRSNSTRRSPRAGSSRSTRQRNGARRPGK